MVDAVKRTYTSTLRARQARGTQEAIVAAATRLFIERGFGPTTIDAVADAAGVSRKTVFTSVGGKVELLKVALDWLLVGDEQAIALAERPEMRSTLLESDPVALLRGLARIVAGINNRLGALYEVLIAAAGQDPAARVLLDELEEQRRKFMSELVIPRLRELGALRQDLRIEHAVDIAWLHTDPHVYVRLVLDRGWSPDEFEWWLHEAVCRQLLAPS
ncbi:TetR/AcrR family transcriptional regulator [Kribbella sindirgiensis]|uniref:TetR/AcrR family transcriptional regulator n=1 Tax=Kribbella sindirgiensis TaxID=1124744 RepID=A0A4R0IMR0_9ACTN|nr:TetR/AcrR family transcriptional regulator [Kribbella sindirgiensis]TCC34903.1 TetR/AcrR family transcriptional regulator [Kribbella sindirgiensis]